MTEINNANERLFQRDTIIFYHILYVYLYKISIIWFRQNYWWNHWYQRWIKYRCFKCTFTQMNHDTERCGALQIVDGENIFLCFKNVWDHILKCTRISDAIASPCKWIAKRIYCAWRIGSYFPVDRLSIKNIHIRADFKSISVFVTKYKSYFGGNGIIQDLLSAWWKM